MNTTNDGMACRQKCWLTGLAVGLAVFVLALAVLGWSFFGSLVVGVVVAAAVGKYLISSRCTDDQAPVSTEPAAPKAPEPAPAPQAEPAPAPAAEAAPEPVAETAAPAPEATPEPQPAPQVVTTASSIVKPSAVLPGQQELAARKGSWRYNG